MALDVSLAVLLTWPVLSRALGGECEVGSFWHPLFCTLHSQYSLNFQLGSTTLAVPNKKPTKLVRVPEAWVSQHNEQLSSSTNPHRRVF